MNTLNCFGVRAFFTLVVLVGLLSFGGVATEKTQTFRIRSQKQKLRRTFLPTLLMRHGSS